MMNLDNRAFKVFWAKGEDSVSKVVTFQYFREFNEFDESMASEVDDLQLRQVANFSTYECDLFVRRVK